MNRTIEPVGSKLRLLLGEARSTQTSSLFKVWYQDPTDPDRIEDLSYSINRDIPPSSDPYTSVWLDRILLFLRTLNLMGVPRQAPLTTAGQPVGEVHFMLNNTPCYVEYRVDSKFPFRLTVGARHYAIANAPLTTTIQIIGMHLRNQP